MARRKTDHSEAALASALTQELTTPSRRAPTSAPSRAAADAAPDMLAAGIRNRVKGLRFVKSSDIRLNPNNWRKHPDHQRSAFRAMLDDVGFVGAVIVRETPTGLELIDGE